MSKRKKVKWELGDIFGITLKNNKYCVGHILSQRMPNTIRIALYDEVIDNLETIDVHKLCYRPDLISLIEVTKEQVEFGVWKIIGNKKSDVPISMHPNEQFRSQKWIGSSVYDAALAEDFVNAFYALIPWDDWYDPNFLNELLINIDKKPKNLILIKS